MRKRRKQWLAMMLVVVMVLTVLPAKRGVAKESTPYGYLLSYTNAREAQALGDSLHLAYSRDGRSFTALNSNTGICFAKNIGGNKNVNTNGLRTPCIFRKTDGTYGMVARNTGKESYLYVYDSKDLINFANEHKLSVTEKVERVYECVATDGKQYDIYWSDGNKTYRTTTRDLSVATVTSEITNYKPKLIENQTELPEGAVASSILEITKEEYERLGNKLGPVTNIGIDQISVTANYSSNVKSLLPKTVSASYSDGSLAEVNVNWNMDDLNKVNTWRKGTYQVRGTVSQKEYANPFIEQRADPCITKGEDGYYYFTASYPMCGGGDRDGYDKVILRRAKTIEGLAAAKEITIWDCDDSDTEYRYIWAPEIHCIKGVYYIFYTSSVSSNSVWGIRPHVLMCTNAAKIMEASSWTAKGQILSNVSDHQAFTNFSLDMTYFENAGHHYVMWAQTDGFSSLYITEIDPKRPWQCIRDCAKISIPEYSWERINENVNEGPSVLIRNGKVYCTYSASGTGVEYCIGLLTANADADLLDPASWIKQSYPVLTSADVPGEYGPGHNSFTVDEDGKDIFVYHARGERCYHKECEWANDGSLYDPCRDARMKRVHWAADGTPILKMTYAQEVSESFRTVKATIIVPENKWPIWTFSYQASPGGTVKGATTQKVEEGKRGSNVTAVPAKGYRFVTWSDGVKTASRSDSASKKNQSFKAIFEKIEIPAKKIVLSHKKVTIGVDETISLKAMISPSDTTNKWVRWTSNHKSVKVSGTGKLFAKKKGKAVIKAMTANGKQAVCNVTVKAAPTKVYVTSKKTLKKGSTYQIKPILSKSSASNKITYFCNKTSVATVSQSGKVKAVHRGSAKIIVSTYNGKKAMMKIIVK